ncbi:MAG: ATP-binding cassette domain-containing protein [Candidatus Binataceae bacterium]
MRLAEVSFAYSDSISILRDVTIQLAAGWTGVAGANGAGKTTFIRLISGELKPARGNVRIDPPSASIYVCAQTALAITPAIAAFARAQDGVARRLHAELALDPGALERWATLSPGERKRWQVGAALAAEPAVLILDEPTDHLDADARGLLLEVLSRFRGVGIVISHDRAMLERLTSYTVRVHDGSARIWRGAYADAKRAWEAEAREHHASFERLKHERDKLKRRLADTRRVAQSAADDWSAGAGKRMRGPRDHDATSMMAKGKSEMASARLSRDVGNLRRGVDRIEEHLREFKFRKEKGRALFLDYVSAPMSRIFTLDQSEILAGSRRVLEEVHLVVGRASKIHLAGPNGAGKTTLLGAMLRGSHLPPERVMFLPQELSEDDGAPMLAAVRELGAGDRARVLTLAAALGVDPERILGSQSPSPGEARKLALAYGLGRQVWACVLDEPSNHLDMPAIERLEEALAAYPGALVIVTHDDQLASRTTREQWTIENRRIDISSRPTTA